MKNPDVDTYLQYQSRRMTLKREFDELIAYFGEVAKTLEAYRKYTLPGASIPPGIGLTPLISPVFGEWPTATKINEVWSTLATAISMTHQVWRILPDEDRARLNPPDDAM